MKPTPPKGTPSRKKREPTEKILQFCRWLRQKTQQTAEAVLRATQVVFCVACVDDREEDSLPLLNYPPREEEAYAPPTPPPMPTTPLQADNKYGPPPFFVTPENISGTKLKRTNKGRMLIPTRSRAYQELSPLAVPSLSPRPKLGPKPKLSPRPTSSASDEMSEVLRAIMKGSPPVRTVFAAGIRNRRRSSTARSPGCVSPRK